MVLFGTVKKRSLSTVLGRRLMRAGYSFPNSFKAIARPVPIGMITKRMHQHPSNTLLLLCLGFVAEIHEQLHHIRWNQLFLAVFVSQELLKNRRKDSVT